MHVLLIHSDPNFATGLGDTLERLGATVDYAATGRLGLRLAATGAFHAIVLAARLPGTDGLLVCRALREQGFQKAIVMVGAAAGSDRTVVALQAGADDYRAPPVAFVEVHARLRVLCRRRTSPAVLRIGDLEFDPVSTEVRRQGQRLAPTPMGLKLLQVLIEAAPRVVSHAELEACLWGQDISSMSETNLRAQIHALRAVIDKPFDVPLIRTYRSAGYRMTVPRSPRPSTVADCVATAVASG